MTKKLLIKPIKFKYCYQSSFAIQDLNITITSRTPKLVIYLFFLKGLLVKIQDTTCNWKTTTLDKVVLLPNSVATTTYNFIINCRDRLIKNIVHTSCIC